MEPLGEGAWLEKVSSCEVGLEEECPSSLPVHSVPPDGTWEGNSCIRLLLPRLSSHAVTPQTKREYKWLWFPFSVVPVYFGHSNEEHNQYILFEFPLCCEETLTKSSWGGKALLGLHFPGHSPLLRESVHRDSSRN